MVERGDRCRLPAEALHEHGIGRELRREQLQRHAATERGVARQQHLGHAADPQAQFGLVAPGEQLRRAVRGLIAAGRARAGEGEGWLRHAVSG